VNLLFGVDLPDPHTTSSFEEWATVAQSVLINRMKEIMPPPKQEMWHEWVDALRRDPFMASVGTPAAKGFDSWRSWADALRSLL
jgi:hypothetical protein